MDRQTPYTVCLPKVGSHLLIRSERTFSKKLNGSFSLTEFPLGETEEKEC